MKNLFGEEPEPKKLDPAKERDEMLQRHGRKSGMTTIVHGHAKDLIENKDPIIVEEKIDQKGKTDGELTDEFLQFVAMNPEIVDEFADRAFELKRAGNKTASIELILNGIRWTRSIQTKSEDDFKINNNHKPFMSKLLACKYPELRHFFRFRKGSSDNRKFYDWLEKETGCGNPVSIFSKGEK